MKWGEEAKRRLDGFRDALDTCGLTYLGYTGNTFEWKVAGGTYMRVRLDMCVANPAWSLAFPAATVEHKNVATSGHVPVLLRISDMYACAHGPRQFKYEICLERDPMHVEVIGAG